MSNENKTGYKFCKITAITPKVLSKGFLIGPDGEIIKSPSGQLSEGKFETITVEGPIEFAEVLSTLNSSNALTYGVPKHKDSGEIFSRKTAKKGDVTRTRDDFEFKEEPGILMIDVDDKTLSFEDICTALSQTMDGFDTAPKVLAHSASSHIYNGETEIVGESGKRVYIFVKDAKDIERAGKVIGERLKLAGNFWYQISNSGSRLERTIMDTLVYQPERMDYAGGAFCQSPLDQRRPEPIVLNDDAEPLDTRRAIKSLSVDEMNELAEIKREAKLKITDEQKNVRAKWVLEKIQEKETAEQRSFTDVEREELRISLTEASEKGLLYGDFVLYPEKGGSLTVGEVLDNIDKWHGTKFADPLEPDYRNDNRIAWANLKSGGRPYIWSYAHGGKRYTLIRPTTQLAVIKGDFPRLVEDVLSVMRIDSIVYEQGRSLVRVAGDKVERVEDAWLRNYIEQIIKFFCTKETKEGFSKSPQHCPPDVSKRIASLYGSWKLKNLKSVITLPIMRLDGSILDQPGYDESTNLLLVNNNYESFPKVPVNPSMDVVKAALENIWKPFSLFPFSSNTDRGVLLACLLSIVVRAVLKTNPGFLFKSATFGSGKSLLAMCIEAAANASKSIMAWPDQQAEQRKSLVSVLQTAPPIIILDNLIGNWNSPDLAAMMTSDIFTDRILGRSENIDVVTTSLIIGTGNNVIPTGDLSRRVLSCILDPQEERPDKRDFPWNPLDLINEDVLQYRIALLTVLRGYISAGSPVHGDGKFGSFDDWERVVRQAVCWIKENDLAPVPIDDPLKSIDDNFAEDPETDKLRALLLNWYDVFKDKPVAVAEIIDYVKHYTTTPEQYFLDYEPNPFLVNILQDICHDQKYAFNARILGSWIKKYKNRVIDDLSLKPATKLNGINRWFVQKLSV